MAMLLCVIRSACSGYDRTCPASQKATLLTRTHESHHARCRIPGLGQCLQQKNTGKYHMFMPVFGGLVYSVSFNSNNYNMKDEGPTRIFTDNIPETTHTLSLLHGQIRYLRSRSGPETYDLQPLRGFKDRLLTAVDYYKKYRDLSYIGIAAWYTYIDY
jgi:hypothetical protein